MREFLDNTTSILEAVLDFLVADVEELVEVTTVDDAQRGRKLTPFQKAMQARRQTVATHTYRPAKASVFYMHAVRAIFQNLRGRGESFHGAAKGGQNIARTMMTKYKYATGQQSGQVKLTGKGLSRNKMHAREPRHIRDKKQKAYDYIMGIQRQTAQRQQQVQRKAMGAG